MFYFSFGISIRSRGTRNFRRGGGNKAGGGKKKEEESFLVYLRYKHI